IILWAILWNTFVWSMSVILLAEQIPQMLLGANPNQGGFLDQWFMVLFFVPFWAVGIISAVVILRRGRRRATVEVRDGLLSIVTRGLCFSRRREWQSGELLHVEAAKPVMFSPAIRGWHTANLRVVPTHGKRISLLPERDLAEMEWVATLI